MNDDRVYTMMEQIFGKKHEPGYGLPTAVRERADYFSKADMPYFCALLCTLAYDEPYSKECCEEGGCEWLPVSDEFKRWLDEPPYTPNIKEILLAVYMIYGEPLEAENESK